VTTRVLVLSDTHLGRGADLPNAVLELADCADHVLHAGDVASGDVLDTLEALAPVTVVCGNVDGHDVALRAPGRASIMIDGVEIGMMHDPGPSTRRHQTLRDAFPDAQVLVYGHTHEPEITWLARSLIVLNPGSPTQRRRAASHTVGWLEIDQGRVVDASIVGLD
jgi:putative phosphoesterase